MSSICSASAISRAPAASRQRPADDGLRRRPSSPAGRRSPGFPGPGVQIVTLPPVTAADEGFSGLVDLRRQSRRRRHCKERRSRRCWPPSRRQAGYRHCRGVSVRPPADAFRAPAADRGDRGAVAAGRCWSPRCAISFRSGSSRAATRKRSISSTAISTWSWCMAIRLSQPSTRLSAGRGDQPARSPIPGWLPRRRRRPRRALDVLVSAGGGAAGARLAAAVPAAAAGRREPAPGA